MTCGLFTGHTIAPNATVSVEIDGVINAPTTTGNTLIVDTTSDTQNSNTFSIVGAQLSLGAIDHGHAAVGGGGCQDDLHGRVHDLVDGRAVPDRWQPDS